MIKLLRSLTSLIISLILAIVMVVPPAFALDDAITEQMLKAKESSSLNQEQTSLERAKPSTDEKGKADILAPGPDKTDLKKLPLSFVNPPLQPTTGPGGNDYIYKEVKKSLYCLDTTQQQCPQKQDEYWIFEPSNVNYNRQNLPNLPLIVFLHGWSLMSPNYYGDWIEHIVKKGNIVIFPIFQNKLEDPINAHSVEIAVKVIINATKDALEKLRTKYSNNENIAAQKIALIGHSAGGAMVADVAAKIVTPDPDQPTFNPVAIVSVEPYAGELRYDDLAKIPATSFMLSIVGNQDIIAMQKNAKHIFYKTTNISSENKDFVRVNCDLRNQIGFMCIDPLTDFTCPKQQDATNCLTAGHLAPLSYKKIIKQTGEGKQLIRFLMSSLDISDVSSNDIPDVIKELIKLLEGITEEELTKAFQANAIDYYSFWKLSVGLSNLAFYGKDREYALSNTDKQKDMGQWSSLFGSVNQLYVTDNP